MATLAITAVNYCADAQNNSIARNTSSAKHNDDLAIFSGSYAPVADANVNAKALKDFSKSFKNATNAKWYGATDGFFANFSDKGIETKVTYDLKGNWHCTMRTYDESRMPSDVRETVKSKYYDFEVLVIYEIAHSNNVTYIIKIQDDKTLKTLRLINGEMEVIGDYVRG